MNLKPALKVRLEDPEAERLRLHTDARIAELQALPFAGAKILRGIELPDFVEVPIRHGLGRAPIWVGISVPYAKNGVTVTNGLILEWRDKYNSTGLPIDRSQFIVLAAYSHTSTIYVDLVVL